MQRLEVSGAVRPIYGSLGVKRISLKQMASCLHEPTRLHSLYSPTLKPVPLDVLGWRCDSFESPSSGLDLHNPLTMTSTSHHRCDLKSTKVSYSSDGPTVTASLAVLLSGSIDITVYILG